MSLGPGLEPGCQEIRTARNAVYAVFISNGFMFASWASRIPQVRAELRVTPGVLGLILLCTEIGSAVATPLSGLIISWLGETRTVIVMSWITAAGLGTAGALPRFDAGWSIGTVAGAACGAAMVAARVPVVVHLLAAALAVAVAVPAAARGFLHGSRGALRQDVAAARRRPLAAWAETRTLLIGLFVLCMAFTEGTGNDWLSLAVIDGYHAAAALGNLTYAIFLAAMTAGRWFGPGLVGSYGRVRVLRACAAVALTGLLLIAFGTHLPVALAGAVLLGLGTSLGFPVGLSAAADDSRYAPGRVSTAASIGYAAFLAGPPAVGFLADHVGVQHSLSLAGVLLVAAFILCRATRTSAPSEGGATITGS
jgi:hypothetical protein